MGPNYIKCKETILTSFQVKNVDKFDELFKQENSEIYLPYLCVAFYQNITLLYKTLKDSAAQMSEMFKPLIKKNFKYDESYAMDLLNNKHTNSLRVDETNWKEIDFNLLLVEIKYTILYSKSSLIEPLKSLLADPATIMDKFLPTMPQDQLFDIKTALGTVPTESTRFYACPNGHIYTIGNCGRPWVTAKCTECNEVIGGANHALTSENKDIDTTIQDKTLRGYCIIEEAAQLPDVPSNIRELNAQGYHLEKFFINACMYLACGDQDEHINNVKKGMAHQAPDVKNFFWLHMKKDLHLACKALNLTLDEIYILLHRICYGFISYKKSHANDMDSHIDFYTKQNRQHWENLFYKSYLESYLTKTSEKLTEANQAIKELNTNKDDENQTKIYFMAYELLNPDPAKAMQLYENVKFWKFRPIVTFDLMSIELKKETKSYEFSLLKKFTDSLYQLQMLPNLVEIIKLVKFLSSVLNKNLYKSEAKKKSLNNILSDIELPRGMICVIFSSFLLTHVFYLN
jgi:hypothetical protein